MKSFSIVFIVLLTMSLEQSFAGWLVSPSTKLTTEDQKEFKELQKYQEPLKIIKGKNTTKPQTITKPAVPMTRSPKDAEETFASLQKKIASYSTLGKKAAYTTFVKNIKELQAKDDLSKAEKDTLASLVEKANSAINNLPITTPTGTGSTKPSSTLTGKKTIGSLTFAPENFTSKTASGTILGKFNVSQNTTLHHLDLTVRSDAPIALLNANGYILLEKDTGIEVAKTDTYTLSDANTLKIMFDSAFLIRTGNYEIVTDFKDNKNTYYQSHLDKAQTSRETQTFAATSYMLTETTLVK